MDSIEQAIRNAFAKGQAEDPAFRERVYRSAQAALERAVLANTAMTPETIAKRRRHLLDTIAAVESEFAVAVAPEVPVSVEPPRRSEQQQARPQEPPMEAPPIDVGMQQPAAVPRARDGRVEPSFGDAPDAAVPQPSPVHAEPEPANQRAAASETPKPARKRRGFPWGLITGLVTIIVVVGLAFWTALEFGLIGGSGGQQSTPASSNQPASQPVPGEPGGRDALADWMPVFAPNDPTTVAATPGARAEVVGEGEDRVLRLVSSGDGSIVRFDIGAGVMERLAGKRAVFDIVALAPDREAQMSVSCRLSGLKDCGRNRYTVGVERAEFLFEVDIPQAATGGPGSIEIISDVSGDGKAVDIIEIRASVAAADE